MTDVNNVKLSIAVAEARTELKNGQAETTKDKLRITMNKTKDHWMLTDEGGRLTAAVLAVVLELGQDTEESIKLQDEMT